MNVHEIRPYTTYMGHGGLQRRVKSVSMDVAGGLGVSWRAVKPPRGTNVPTGGNCPIEDFADWALTVIDTLSDDLKHYLPR